MINRSASVIVALVMITNVIGLSAGKHKFYLSDAEIRRRLKQLNKPAVKSIQSLDGDIIDCVHIMDQPAFDHPLLKNNIIQMEPSSYPKNSFRGREASSRTNVRSVRQLWHRNGKCPDNTVPIRRTTREDLLRSGYVKKRRKSIPMLNHASLYSTNNHEYAVIGVENGLFNGASARINLWQPKVQVDNEFSLAQIWVSGGSSDYENTVEAGWQVYPKIYGDHNPRLFVFSTNDSYRTGCYNTECGSFVHVNKEIGLGATLEPVSTYGGPQQDVFIAMWKDYRDGNWWVRVGDTNVGYWPSSVVPGLADHATAVHWGGEILNFEWANHTTTEMGSGHFPEEGFGKAALFKNLQAIDTKNTAGDPQGLRTYTTNSSCYNLITGHTDSMGTYFYYGGPGRNPRCP